MDFSWNKEQLALRALSPAVSIQELGEIQKVIISGYLGL